MISLMQDNLVGFLFRVSNEQGVAEGNYMRVESVGQNMVAWYNVEDNSLAALPMAQAEILEKLFEASDDYTEMRFSSGDAVSPTLH
jgi:hypothetical protein